MAGVSGNVFTLAVAKQTAKGSAASNSTGYKMKLTGGDIAPVTDVIQTAETDASSQQGVSLVTGARIGPGTPQHYVRPNEFALLAYLLLGANADSGAGPYTHTATLAQNPPYATLWKNIGAGTLVDSYVDCRISQLVVRGGNGQALTCDVTWAGLTAVGGATDNTNPVSTQNPTTFPQTVVKLAGADPATIEQFELIINRNSQHIQGDGALTPYDVVHGRCEVSGTGTMLFQSDADYRSFHYGATNGTGLVSTLFSQAVDIKASLDANNYVDFSLASAAWTQYDIPPDPSGAPIRATFGFRSLPSATIANYIQIVTGNNQATP